ncbi:MAG TPA: adenylate/guanylate cyclase domain-containing protein [Alphaproteobacteria bacterium]|nr:adenylate/guanylate cyclase domain-containing protein [Alphaproteobacteria bacterium]
MQQIADWLEKLGLGQYAQRFAENEIDISVLPHLSDQDLKDIGVPLGHRRKLLAAITEFDGAARATPEPALQTEAKTQDTAERRQVTVMFSDLAGSTALSARMDPEDLREVISVYQKSVAETVRRFDGFVAKYMGDGVLIYFGYPQAHEDDAERAVRAGLEVVTAVAGLKAPVSLQTRIGIETGLVVVGDLIGSGEAQERGIVGETPNLAARLQGIAEPNTVVIGEGTRRLLGNLFEFEDLGAKNLKGIAGPVRAWAALRASSAEGRFEALHASGLTALVGREEETELLLRRWARAKSGEGQVALLSGEAGIGKSRLAAAILENLAGEPHTRLRYFCSPQHTDSAFYPIIGQMERAAGLTYDDTPPAKLDKLDLLLAPTSTPKQEAALFAEMLSLPNDGRYPALDLPPPQRRQRTLEALIAQIEALTRSAPVLMIFEDAHWTDPTSLEAFGRAVDRIRTLRVLLIVTYRPEFEPPWIGRPHVTALTINRWAERDIDAMIDGVVGNKHLPRSVRQDIIERSDGIPLFVEEMTKAVLEAANEGTAERVVAVIPSPSVAVPASLHASLMARLDRLGPAKELAQIGAAIGREFSHGLMAAVAGKPEAEVQPALDRLVAAGLLFRQGSPPHATYLFKHALVQDAAYGTLLRGPRQELHARIAAAIETGMPERVEREPDLLAYHYAEAGQPDTAAGYWLAAGRLAARRSANSEAVAHLRRGIAAVRGLPETLERNRLELALQLALGPALVSSRGFGDAEASTGYQRAAELARRLGDDRDRFAATWGLWITIRAKSASDHMRLRLQYLGEMVEAAERTGDAELLLQAHHSSWSTRIWNGEFASASEHVRSGLALYDSERHHHHALMYGGHDPGVCGNGQGAVALWALGWPDRAVQSARESIVLGETLDHMPSLLHSLRFATSVYFLRRQAADVLACSARLLALGSEHGLKMYEAIGGVFHGWALIQQLDAQAGLAELRAAVATYATTAHMNLDLYRAILAEAELRAGNFEEGTAILIQGELSTDEWWRAGYLRLRGDLLLRGSNDDRGAAERRYRQAISVAAGQQAKSLELRAATSLAMLLGEQGKRSEGYAALAPVYGWFTEGFGTLDLKEAKALLGELHP